MGVFTHYWCAGPTDNKPMMRLVQNAGFFLLSAMQALLVQLVLPSRAGAQEFDRRLKTIYLGGDYGLSTYKSKLVESNDTGSITSYSIGANIGTDKSAAFVLRSDQSSIAFALNESKIESSWRDTIIRYRWGYVYFGAIIGQTTWDVKRTAEDLFAGTGSGYGGNFGLLLPLGNRNLFTIDIASVTASSFVEKNEKDVKMGARTDISMWSNIGLTRDAIDLLVGYKQRSHSVSYDGTSYAEVHTATFFGLQMGSDF